MVSLHPMNENIVLNCLTYGYAQSAHDIAQKLKLARFRASESDIDDALIKLLEDGKIEAVGKGYRRA